MLRIGENVGEENWERGYMKTLVLSCQHWCKPKAALKNKFYLKKFSEECGSLSHKRCSI